MPISPVILNFAALNRGITQALGSKQPQQGGTFHDIAFLNKQLHGLRLSSRHNTEFLSFARNFRRGDLCAGIGQESGGNFGGSRGCDAPARLQDTY